VISTLIFHFAADYRRCPLANASSSPAADGGPRRRCHHISMAAKNLEHVFPLRPSSASLYEAQRLQRSPICGTTVTSSITSSEGNSPSPTALALWHLNGEGLARAFFVSLARAHALAR